MSPNWKGDLASLLSQVVLIVEQVITAGKIQIEPPLFSQDDLRRRLVLTLNMTKIVQHIWNAIRPRNVESTALIFDSISPTRSTADMRPWYTGKPHERAAKSHVNFCVYDSAWEASEAFSLDRDDNVTAWAKNDHLGFEIVYIHRGVVRKYRPDFLIKLTNGVTLVLEVKGQETLGDQTKIAFLREWVDAVNAHGAFGRWAWDVSRDPGDIQNIVNKHARMLVSADVAPARL